MADEILYARTIHTHDIEENWNRVTRWVPSKGELIIYDPDNNHRYSRYKTGNGVNLPKDLPFDIDEAIIASFDSSDRVAHIDAGRITDY